MGNTEGLFHGKNGVTSNLGWIKHALRCHEPYRVRSRGCSTQSGRFNKEVLGKRSFEVCCVVRGDTISLKGFAVIPDNIEVAIYKHENSLWKFT